MQHFQSDFAVRSALGVRSGGAEGGAPTARIRQLGPVRRDDVLSTRSRTIVARDHRRFSFLRGEVEAPGHGRLSRFSVKWRASSLRKLQDSALRAGIFKA